MMHGVSGEGQRSSRRRHLTGLEPLVASLVCLRSV